MIKVTYRKRDGRYEEIVIGKEKTTRGAVKLAGIKLFYKDVKIEKLTPIDYLKWQAEAFAKGIRRGLGIEEEE